MAFCLLFLGALREIKMGAQKIDVIIADTQFLVIDSLKNLIINDERLSLNCIVDNLSQLEASANKITSGLILLDFAAMFLENFEPLKQLTAEPHCHSILIIAQSVSKQELTELSKAGIKNILLKNASREEIIQALDNTLKGKKFYSDELLDLLFQQKEPVSLTDENKNLTPSEIEIVKLISDGKTTKEIANLKNLSFHTINTHRKNIFRKLGVNNTSELIIYAIKAGLIDNIEYYI
jgi:DNA-binding NarL/FixJ family response regulator